MVSTDDCWLYAGYIKSTGYGAIWHSIDGVDYLDSAHRTMYKQVKGEIPEGLELDHLCRVIQCINPEHLEPVTSVENNYRKFGKDLCKRGHKLEPGNIYINLKNKSTGRVGRQCRTCRLAYSTEWNRLKKLKEEQGHEM